MMRKLESDVLIVDDEVRLVNNLQTLLNWEGYQTRLASNGQEAIELIEAQPPSIIISDIMMPSMDGYELLAYVKEKFPHIPVIAVTGFGSIDSAIKAMQMGASDYILKPFDHGLIVETVARAAEEARRNWYKALHQEMVVAVSGTLSLELVMERVLDLSKLGTGAENGDLFILDEKGQVAQRALPAQIESFESGQKIIEQLMAQGLADRLYKKGQSVLIGSAKQDEGYLDLPERAPQIQSVIGVPCISRQKVQGIIVLLHSEAEQFDATDLAFLESIAMPVAMAIENARLFERERRLREDMVALYEAGLEIASSLDEKTTARTILQQIASLIEADNCAIAYRNRDNEALNNHLNLIFQEGEWRICKAGEKLHLSANYPTLPEILAEKKVIIKNTSDPDLSPAEKAWLKRRHVHSLMLYPLLWHGYVKGLITLTRAQKAKPFTARDAQLMIDLSPQAATAIENARLFEVVATQTAWVEAQAHELEDERRKLAAILHSASDGILAVDDQGNIILANPALDGAFEIDHQLILDRPYRVALQNTPLLDMFDQSRVENKALTLEIEASANRTYYAQVTPVPNMGYMAILRDISHLKELDRMRVELLSIASHDLKNPLTVVQGYTSLLVEMGELNDAQLNAVKRIDRAAVSMTALIGDLLDLARLESGLGLQLEPCVFNVLTQNVVADFEEQAQFKNISLKLKLDKSLDKVACDVSRIRQALANLITNAIKYTPAGGDISVETLAAAGAEKGATTGGLRLRVRDNGYGIAAEDLPHIFDRFYRVRTYQTESIEGTGLGLAITKSIIEQHGGELWVESEAGQGSVFTFSL